MVLKYTDYYHKVLLLDEGRNAVDNRLTFFRNQLYVATDLRARHYKVWQKHNKQATVYGG